MRSTCPAFRILLDFITALIFGEHNFLSTLSDLPPFSTTDVPVRSLFSSAASTLLMCYRFIFKFCFCVVFSFSWLLTLKTKIDVIFIYAAKHSDKHFNFICFCYYFRVEPVTWQMFVELRCVCVLISKARPLCLPSRCWSSSSDATCSDVFTHSMWMSRGRRVPRKPAELCCQCALTGRLQLSGTCAGHTSGVQSDWQQSVASWVRGLLR